MSTQVSTAQGMTASTQALTLYLLAIRGTLSLATLEEARAIHNATAGAPQNVAAAQSLGDLSHMVYVPAGPPPNGTGAGEFLILDVWRSLDGLNQFFANPQVQEQAGQIFASRDPVVWMPADGFAGYHLAAPYGKNDRIVALVRGTVKSHNAARTLHNMIIGNQISQARRAGDISHEAYFRLAPPDAPEALEFFAVDVWIDAAGMQQYYAQPAFMQGVQDLFTGPPTTSAWAHPLGDWVEW